MAEEYDGDMNHLYMKHWVILGVYSQDRCIFQICQLLKSRTSSLCIISAYREKYIDWKKNLNILGGKSQYIKNIYQEVKTVFMLKYVSNFQQKVLRKSKRL